VIDMVKINNIIFKGLLLSLVFLLSTLSSAYSLNYQGNKFNVDSLRGQASVPMQKVYFALKSYQWVRYPSSQKGLAVLQVTIVYYGTDVLLNVEESLSFPQNIEVVSEQPVKLGSWEPGVPKTVMYTINVTGFPEKTFATINIQYSAIARRIANGYDILNLVGSGTINFQLSFPASHRLSYFISPSMLKKDNLNIITIDFTNTGTGTIYDLSSKIVVTGATLVDVYQPIEVKVNKIESNANHTIRIKIIPVSSQVVLTIDANYIDQSGNQVNEKFTSTLAVIKSFNVILVAEPSKIRTGSSQRVGIKIINLGDVPLLDSVLYIRPTQGSKLVIDPTYFKVGDIPVGGTKTVNIELNIPNTITGTQILQYTLIYNSESREKAQISGSISIFAVEKAQLTITSIEIVPKKPSIGQTIIVSITIINLGSLPVSKVNVTAYHSDGLMPLRQESYFLGQLQSQFPMSIPFSFKVIRGGVQTIDFEIKFTDVYGLNWSLSRVVTLNINSSLEKPTRNVKGGFKREHLSSSIPWIFISIIGVIIVVIISYYVYRKIHGGQK